MILDWAQRFVPALSAIYIPGVEKWQADYLSLQSLDKWEWALHLGFFQQLCLRWGTPDMDLMGSKFNRKVPRRIRLWGPLML